jgi:hypothetical protein
MANESRFDPLTPTAPKSRLRRWLRRILVVLALLFFAVLASFFGWRQYALNARNAEIAKLRAAGDPVWFADMEPTPLDPAEDGTPELRKAFAAIKPLPKALDEEFTALTNEDEEHDRSTPEEREAFIKEHGDIFIDGLGKTLGELWADEDDPPPGPREPFAVREKKLLEKLRPHVEANEDAYGFVRQVLAKPKFRFDVDYSHPQPMVMDIPDNQQFIELENLLHVRWRCELHDGDEVAATGTLVECIGLARRFYAQSRELTGVSVACARLSQVNAFLAEMLERGEFDVTRSSDLLRSLTEFEAELRLGPAIRGEKAMAMTTIESFLDFGGFGRMPPKNWLTYKVVEPLVWMNETNYLRAMSAQAVYADRYDKEALTAIDEEYDREVGEPLESEKPGMYTKLTRMAQIMLQPAMGMFQYPIIAVRDQTRAARIALAVDAYRRQHGRLPRSLDEVKSDALPEIPHDIVNDEPLEYYVDSDAFVICASRHAANERRHLAHLVKKRDSKPDEKAPPKAPEPAENTEFEQAEESVEDIAMEGEEQGEVEEEAYQPESTPTGAILVVYPRDATANAADGKTRP